MHRAAWQSHGRRTPPHSGGERVREGRPRVDADEQSREQAVSRSHRGLRLAYHRSSVNRCRGIDAGASLADALASGVRWGAAAVALPGSTVPSPGDLSLATVTLSSQLPLSLIHISEPT